MLQGANFADDIYGYREVQSRPLRLSIELLQYGTRDIGGQTFRRGSCLRTLTGKQRRNQPHEPHI